MLGLELLMAGAILNPQSDKLVQVGLPETCVARHKPHITVEPSQSRIVYDFSKSRAELNNMNSDTISPYGNSHKTNVSGLMSGKIKLKSSISFLTEKSDEFNLGCIYVSKINVTIDVDPTIYVANEFEQGGCMHNAILAHEMKHVNEDQYVVNKYINAIGQALSEKIETLGAAHGPYYKKDLYKHQNRVQHELHNDVRIMNKILNEERRERQQAIDTLEEYESIGFQCKSRNKPRRK